jgi:integrase
MLAGRIHSNPFSKRPRFATTKKHRHEACTDDDEALHRVLAWLFASELHTQTYSTQEAGANARLLVLAAGTIAWCALTGLRSGEPATLLRLPPLADCLTNTRNLLPGAISRDRQGVLRMIVTRNKHGQNPFVTIHPVAESFLCAWRAWLALYSSTEEHLFPLGTHDDTTLNRALNRASEALELPHYSPHGFGRAYYVKVRRSQGCDDSAIASDLGQTTNGELIRSTYGDPQDLVGGAFFDWLPADCAPAWNLLNRVASPAPAPALATH